VSASTLDEVLDIDMSRFKEEVSYLRAVEAWARASLRLDFTEGDRIEIVDPTPSRNEDGWHAYREALAVGQTGIAGEIKFNQYSKNGKGGWQVLFMHDHCWSVHAKNALHPERDLTRYWSGPADQIPDGYTPASRMNRTKNFMFPVEWVRRACQ
jgi:hypothetical protein